MPEEQKDLSPDEKLDRLVEAIGRIEERVNPPTSKKVTKITLKTLLWVVMAVGPVFFGWHFAQIKRRDFLECLDTTVSTMQKRTDEATTAARKILGCKKNGCENAVEEFSKHMQSMGHIGNDLRTCMEDILPQTLEDVEKDMRRALKRAFSNKN